MKARNQIARNRNTQLARIAAALESIMEIMADASDAPGREPVAYNPPDPAEAPGITVLCIEDVPPLWRVALTGEEDFDTEAEAREAMLEYARAIAKQVDGGAPRVTDRVPGFPGLTYLTMIEHLKAQVAAIDNERLQLHYKASALEERVKTCEDALRALGAEPGTV